MANQQSRNFAVKVFRFFEAPPPGYKVKTLTFSRVLLTVEWTSLAHIPF